MLSLTEKFIEKSKKIHGDKYDYSKTVYVKAKSKVIITCTEHGDFDQTPNSHLGGNGCPRCHNRFTVGSEEFINFHINKAKSIHKDRYDYSLVDWNNLRKKVIIQCIQHGPFFQLWGNHTSQFNKHGCSKCANYQSKVKQYLPKDEFVSKAIKTHGHRYIYDHVEYDGAHKKVNIECPTHGLFSCTPANHWSNGVGCPKCLHSNPSKGEAIIAKWLTEHNILFEYQKSYPDLWWKSKKGRLKYDFWLPSRNLLIEYDGEHHFLPISWSKKINGQQRLNEQQSKDSLKTEYANKNGLNLLRIPYNEGIEPILERELLSR